MKRRFYGVALATLVLVAGACGTTTVDADLVPTSTPPSTTAPSGPVDQLLSRLADRSFDLGSAIVDGKADPVIADIDALWAAALAQLPRTQFTEAALRQIALLHTAVDRRRPADADKSARNLKDLIDARQ